MKYLYLVTIEGGPKGMVNFGIVAPTKSKAEAEQLFDEFHRMVTGKLDEEKEPNNLGRLTIFAGVRDFPVRVKCATLSWHTLHAALNEQKAATTES